MKLCPGGFSKVKKFLQNVTEDLTKLISDISVITGKIKAFEDNPTVAAIVSVVPVASEIEGKLNAGIDVLVKFENKALSFAEKLSKWLDGETQDAKDMKLVKLAQVSTAIADAKKLSQSSYDTLVQVHIKGLK